MRRRRIGELVMEQMLLPREQWQVVETRFSKPGECAKEVSGKK